jgi:hypothetical protein
MSIENPYTHLPTMPQNTETFTLQSETQPSETAPENDLLVGAIIALGAIGVGVLLAADKRKGEIARRIMESSNDFGDRVAKSFTRNASDSKNNQE